MDEDKYQESSDPNEITIEEITHGEVIDRLPKLTELKRMLEAYLEFAGVSLEDFAVVPADTPGDYLLRMRVIVDPESLMTPEQREIEQKFKQIAETHEW
jgi:hypothetical protein